MLREGSSACLLNNRVEDRVNSDRKDYLKQTWKKVDEQNKI